MKEGKINESIFRSNYCFLQPMIVLGTAKISLREQLEPPFHFELSSFLYSFPLPSFRFLRRPFCWMWTNVCSSIRSFSLLFFRVTEWGSGLKERERFSKMISCHAPRPSSIGSIVHSLICRCWSYLFNPNRWWVHITSNCPSFFHHSSLFTSLCFCVRPFPCGQPFGHFPRFSLSLSPPPSLSVFPPLPFVLLLLHRWPFSRWSTTVRIMKQHSLGHNRKR